MLVVTPDACIDVTPATMAERVGTAHPPAVLASGSLPPDLPPSLGVDVVELAHVRGVPVPA